MCVRVCYEAAALAVAACLIGREIILIGPALE